MSLLYKSFCSYPAGLRKPVIERYPFTPVKFLCLVQIDRRIFQPAAGGLPFRVDYHPGNLFSGQFFHIFGKIIPRFRISDHKTIALQTGRLFCIYRDSLPLPVVPPDDQSDQSVFQSLLFPEFKIGNIVFFFYDFKNFLLCLFTDIPVFSVHYFGNCGSGYSGKPCNILNIHFPSFPSC